MALNRDDKSGKFVPSYRQGDLDEIKRMLQEGKSKQQITLAIMKARDVTESTAWRWIRLAKGEEVKAYYAKKTNQE